MQAALADLRIPKIEVNMTEEGDEPELDLDDDPESAASLNTSRIPIILTVNQASFHMGFLHVLLAHL